MGGRLWDYKRKGVDVAAEVGAMLKDRIEREGESVKFVFAGLSPRDHPLEEWRVARQEVESLVRHRGLWGNSVLVDMAPHEQMPTWPQLAAVSRGLVLALPRVEPWRLMNLEALAVGNVVITVNEGGPTH